MDSHDLLITAGKSALTYLFLLLVVRILGKREVGNFTLIDLIVAFMLSEVVDEIVFSNVTLVKGYLAISVMAALHVLNSWGSFKSPLINRVTEDSACILIRHGEILKDQLARERIPEEELYSLLRKQGVDRHELNEVKQGTLEPDGSLSVLKEDWAKELQKGDLHRALEEGSA